MARSVVALFLLVLSVCTFFTLYQPASAQNGAQAKLRIFNFNTEAGGIDKGQMTVPDWPRRQATCPTPFLDYSLKKVMFLPRYLREQNIDVATLQELPARCYKVPLTATGTPNLPAEQLALIEGFKQQFKAGYEKTVGRSFASDAAFQQELTRVLGKETTDDVWVQFLPFDESFWISMQLLYVEGYPMQIIAKPYDKNTQDYRSATYSRVPLARALTSTDFTPLDDPDRLSDGTRWVPKAPLDTAFGLLNIYNVHTRAGEEACPGASKSFTAAKTAYDSDKELFMLSGDFNSAVAEGNCGIPTEEEGYVFAGLGGKRSIEQMAILKALTSKINFDSGSRIVLNATTNLPPGAVKSQHNGYSYFISGLQTKTPPPLAQVTLPDYYPHDGSTTASPTKPISVRPTAGSPGSVANVPICTPEQSEGAGATDVALAADIEEFFSKGAKGYLVWQYSGDAGLGTEFASDPYAFFRNQDSGKAICSTLKTAAQNHPDKFVGVNMWDAGNSKHSETKIADHFGWLKNTCGVTVVRTFSKEGGAAGAQKILSAANTSGVKVLFAIGDYSNGGGGIPSGVGTEFFTTGYQGEFLSLTNSVLSATSGNSALYGFELANEVHCRGDQNSLEPYKKWGQEIAGILRGGSPNVGYGQKASENTTLCDSPGVNAPSGTSHFQYTNDVPEISITSGHYYNANEKALALGALEQSLSIGKTYYVGEAPATLKAGISVACINPDKYYIQPINGVNSSAYTALRADNPGGVQLDIIRDELIMQGYEARCAAPGMKISLSEQGRDAMNRLFEQPGINGVVLGGLAGKPSDLGPRVARTEGMYSRLDVDYRDILVPLFRDLDYTQPTLKRSIEDFFGHKVTDDTVYTSAELKTSAINTLLTNEQRCTVVYQNLLAQDTMCKKLEQPDQCALYATEIPGTIYNVKTLFEAFETARADQPVIDFCKELVGSTDTVTAPLRKGVSNAPLTIEKAYRLAFMVTSIRLRAPSKSKLLNILTHPLAGWMGPPKPNHAVIVVAFKIPDLLTNKGIKDYTIDTAYDDVGKLTRDSLITEPTQVKIADAGLARRRQLLDKAREYSTVEQDDDWAEIVCLGGGIKVGGVGSPQCKDPLTKALVDIINAQVMVGEDVATNTGTANPSGFGNLLDQISDDGELKCSDKYETAVTINDPGAINAPDDPSHVFTQNWGAALLANLFGDCTHDGEGDGSPSFASTQTPDTGACTGQDWYLKSKFFVVKDMLADGGGDDEDLSVKHFLVYPVGYELKTVEGVLAGSFFTKKQLTDILELQKNNPKPTGKMVDQFQLDKSKITFDGAEDSYSFTDIPRCSEYINAEGELSYRCPELSFSMRLIASAPKAANILGAKLGYWMRKIQLSLNATTQESFGYLQKCATLEEFLLDRCGGTAATLKPAGQTAGSNNPGGSCSSTTTLDDFKYTEPSALPFTGTATYYAPNVFNTTLNTRLSGAAGSDFVGNTTVKDCEVLGNDFAAAKIGASLAGQEFVGCVALLRVGDLYFRNSWNAGNPDPNNVRKVWLKNQAGEVHGPFAVIDVAAGHDAPCLYDRGWAVDIDYNSFKRLFNQTAGPDQVTVCDSESC